MFKLIDRYILKEIIPPFLLGLAAYTFIMLLNQIILSAEMFITRGVAFSSVLKLFVYLLPSIFAFTIPMSVLLGILAGFSRMSSDSEIMAMKTLGVSYLRLLRPLLVFAFFGWLVTSALMLFITPWSNYSWVQTLNQEVIKKVQLNIQPRTFNESVPHMVLYIQDITSEKEWRNIFVYIAKPNEDPRMIMAKGAKMNLFPDVHKAFLSLFEGTVHSYSPAEPENYSVTTFNSMDEEIDVESLFDSSPTRKSVREKDIKEILAGIQELDQELVVIPPEQRNLPEFQERTRSQRSHQVEIHKRLSVPLSCFIFVFLGLPLGGSTRKGGRTSGFTISIILIILYYILITAGEQMAINGSIRPWLGMWTPNIVFALLGFFLFIKSLQESSVFPAVLKKMSTGKKLPIIKTWTPAVRMRSRMSLPFLNTLDRYILKKFVFIFMLAFISMIFLYVIITFVDRIHRIYEHEKPLSLFLEYIFLTVPNFIYLILPVAALVSTLLSLGLLTKFNEITAMKACGISVYRIVTPLILIAMLVSFCSYYLQENVLPYANRMAEQTWDEIRDIPAQTYSFSDRHWVMGRNRERIFHYNYYDPLTSSFSALSIFDLDIEGWNLKRRYFSERGYLDEGQMALANGWSRVFESGQPVSFESSKRAPLAVEEDRSYFQREILDPNQMKYFELKDHIQELEERGFETTAYQVDLHYKMAFPLVCLIMALIGIPFAFSMGKRGTLVGLGLSLFIAAIYWGGISVFRELGDVGYLAPVLAAWGANLIFGFAGLYFLFNLRT
ncbi:LPS export ABC transporter permease LptF [Acidobacteriota bacterium]